jgi:hypothetical protein
MKTTRPIVQRSFVLVTLLGWAACGAACSEPRPQPPRRIGAPDGSYVPTRLTVVKAGTSEEIDGAIVTPRFFTAAGLRPLLGRFFIDGDYVSGPRGVAVLSHGYWVERFQSAPSVIGSAIEIDGRSLVIVGVAPPAFQPDRGGVLWIPKGG